MRVDEALSADAGAFVSKTPAFHIIVLVSGLLVGMSKICNPPYSSSFPKSIVGKNNCYKKGLVSRNIPFSQTIPCGCPI